MNRLLLIALLFSTSNLLLGQTEVLEELTINPALYQARKSYLPSTRIHKYLVDKQNIIVTTDTLQLPFIDDFSLVYSAYICERYSPLRISQMMRISEKLVDEYVALYQRFKDHPDCQHRLEQIKVRASELFNRSKKNGEN